MDSESKQRLLGDDSDEGHDTGPTVSASWFYERSTLLYVALIISLTANAFTLWHLTTKAPAILTSFTAPSPYAGLVREVSQPYVWGTEYGLFNNNETDVDFLWESIDIDDGIIALPDDLALQYGLPLSDRFPWDESKGLYVVTAHHDIHCLKYIHRYVYEAHHQLPFSRSYRHVSHCLDNLRLTVMCEADDLPQPIDLNGTNLLNTSRQCRSWEKYMDWTKKFNACYSQITDQHQTFDQIERYKFCPRGSPYLSQVRERFGLPQDWDREVGLRDLTEKGLKGVGLT